MDNNLKFLHDEIKTNPEKFENEYRDLRSFVQEQLDKINEEKAECIRRNTKFDLYEEQQTHY